MRGVRSTLNCVSDHLEYPPEDAKGYKFVILKCNSCDDRQLCERIRGNIERHINRPTLGDRILTPMQRGLSNG